jgi:hypothetical protein
VTPRVGDDSLAHRVSVAGVLVFLAVVAVEHLLTPSLHPARHQISEYAHADTGALMVAGFLAWAISLAATAACVWHRRRTLPLTLLLAVAALGMMLTASFPTQTSAGALPPGTTLTLTGRIHDLGSGITSLALLVATVVSAAQIRTPRSFRTRVAILVLIAIAASAVLLAIGPDVGGIRQRLVVLAGCVWQMLLLSVLDRGGERADGERLIGPAA